MVTVPNDLRTQGFILILGGAITLLTMRYKERIQLKMRQKQPKDRLEMAFDGYEQLVKDLQHDIKVVRQINTDQSILIAKMQTDANILHRDLVAVRSENRKLIAQLKKEES